METKASAWDKSPENVSRILESNMLVCFNKSSSSREADWLILFPHLQSPNMFTQRENKGWIMNNKFYYFGAVEMDTVVLNYIRRH